MSMERIAKNLTAIIAMVAAATLITLALTFGVLKIPSALGQTLHTWNTGDVLRATDLNANFTALKTGKVGSGVTLVNADVSNSAAIAHSKLATPALVPKAWSYIETTCTAGTCTLTDSSQVTSITWSATGVYNVTLAYTPANNDFAVFVTSHVASTFCAATGQATAAPHVVIRCYSDAGAATDTHFSMLVMDT